MLTTIRRLGVGRGDREVSLDWEEVMRNWRRGRFSLETKRGVKQTPKKTVD